MNVMSMQVWCYECDEYVEGWGLIEEICEKASHEAEAEQATLNQRGNGHSSRSSRNRGAVGLYNSGNSCFINAALQILLNCPTLTGFFREFCQSFVVNREKLNPPQPSIAEHFMMLAEAVGNPEW